CARSRLSRPRCTRSLIGQPLSLSPFDGAHRAHHVVNAKGDAVAVPKIELTQVAVQVAIAAMLVDAAHPAFEDREEAFDRVGVRVPANKSLLACMTFP